MTLETLRATVVRCVPPQMRPRALTSPAVPLEVVPTVITCVVRLEVMPLTMVRQISDLTQWASMRLSIDRVLGLQTQL